MYKSLHYLTTRAMQCIIALVAFFAVGLTASAEYYSINLKQEGATEFYDGELRFISSKAADRTGVVINGAQSQFILDCPGGLKGIGRVILTPAEGTPATALSNLVKGTTMGITPSSNVTVTSDNKIVYTPNTPNEHLQLNLRSSNGALGITPGPDVTIERIEVYTGCYTHKPHADEFVNDDYSFSCVFGHSTVYVSQQGRAWSTIPLSAGNEVTLRSGDYVRQGSDNVVLKLVSGEGSSVVTKVSTLRIASGSTFDVFAPAGYAIESVRFNGDGAEGINGVTGHTSGNLDRFWEPNKGQLEDYARFTYDNVDGYTDESADFICDQILVTCVSLGSKAEAYFNVDTTNPTEVWPVNGAEVVPTPNSFWLTVHPKEGMTFTSVQESAIPVSIGTGSGEAYSATATATIMEDYVVFTVMLPEDFDLTTPVRADFNFPEGVIFAGEQCNTAFGLNLGVNACPNTINIAAGNLTMGSFNIDPWNAYEPNDFSSIDYRFPDGVVHEIRVQFDTTTDLDEVTQSWNRTPINWVYNSEPDPSIFQLRNDMTEEEYPITGLNLNRELGEITFTLAKPISPVPFGRYGLNIPAGVIISNGACNRADRLGFELYKSFTQLQASASPATKSTLKELSTIKLLPAAGNTVEKLADEVTFNYIGLDERWHTVKATVELQGNTVLYHLDTPLVAGVNVPAETTIYSIDRAVSIGGYVGTVPYNLEYTFDPTIEYREPEATYPDCSRVQPLSAYKTEIYRLGVHFGNHNDIAYDGDNAKYYDNPDRNSRCGVILYDAEIGFPEGYSFTEVKTGADLTASTTVQADLDAKWILYFGAGPDLQSGTYRIHFPAGAIRFKDGKLNEEFDYTWTLAGTIPKDMISVVSPSEYNHSAFDYLEIAAGTPNGPLTLTPVADEFNNLWLCQYADNDRTQPITQFPDGQHAKLSVNERGNLIVQLDQMIDNAGAVDIFIKAGTFFDQYGNANADYHFIHQLHNYDLGWPDVNNNDLIKNLSEFHLTVREKGREHDLEFAPVADNYAINFSVELNDDNNESVDLGAYTGCITSIAKNEEGFNVITVSVPEIVQQYIAQQKGYCTLLVDLPGYNADVNADPAMAIRTTGGLPNRKARYDFRIKPDLTYNCYFSFLDLPEDVTIFYEGRRMNYTEDGFVMEGFPDPITAELFSFEGLPEGVECNIRIEGGTQAKGVLDFTRYAKVMTYPFTNNTIDQSEFAASSSFSFIFDREVEEFSDATVETLKNCISSCCNYPYTPYTTGWASSGSVWFGFGIDTWSNPDITFPVGDYHVSVPARVFQFTDGSWNPAISYDFTVTAGTTFRIANHAVTYYNGNGGLNIQKPNSTGTSNRFCNIVLYFDGETASAKDFEFSYDTTEKYIDVNVLDSSTWTYDTKKAKVTFNYDQEKQQEVLVLKLDEELLPPYAMIVIPEGALTTRDGRTNKQYDMWFNILQDGYANLNVYVDDQLDYNTCISYTLPGTAEPLYAYTGTPIDAEHLESLKVESPSYYKISKGELDAENNVYNLWLVIDDSKKFGSTVKTVAKVNCQGGLRDAIVAFGKPTISHGTGTVLPVIPDPEIIRERIEWSEGFSLKAEAATSTGKPVVREVPNDISYVTTEVDETNKQLILHFFDAEGNDFFPFNAPSQNVTVKLTIPVAALFKSSDLWDNATKSVTAEITYSNDVEIVTGDTAYDTTANATTTGKVGSLTDIILGHRRNGARTNDLDGNGSVSIGDVVRLIRQAQQ